MVSDCWFQLFHRVQQPFKQYKLALVAQPNLVLPSVHMSHLPPILHWQHGLFESLPEKWFHVPIFAAPFYLND